MKKNLRIVSAAAAALLAVAPVAATGLSQVSSVVSASEDIPAVTVPGTANSASDQLQNNAISAVKEMNLASKISNLPSGTTVTSADFTATNFTAGKPSVSGNTAKVAVTANGWITVKLSNALTESNNSFAFNGHTYSLAGSGDSEIHPFNNSTYMIKAPKTWNVSLNVTSPATYQVLYTKGTANLYSVDSTDATKFTKLNKTLSKNTAVRVAANPVTGSTGDQYYEITAGSNQGSYVKASDLQTNAVENDGAYFATIGGNELANDATVYATTANSKAKNIGDLKTAIRKTVNFMKKDNTPYSKDGWDKYVFNGYDDNSNYLDHGNATSDQDLITQLRNAGIPVSGEGDKASFNAGSTAYTITVRSNNGKRVNIVFENTDAVNETAPAFQVRSDIRSHVAGADSTVNQIAQREGHWSYYVNENKAVPTISLVQRDSGTFNPLDYIRAVNNVKSHGLISFEVKNNNVDWTKPGLYSVEVSATNSAKKTTDLTIPVVVSDANGKMMTAIKDANVYKEENGSMVQANLVNFNVLHTGSAVRVYGSAVTKKLNGQDVQFYRIVSPTTNLWVEASALKNGVVATTPAETTTTKEVMHIATIYDKNGKATNEPVLRAYHNVTVVSTPVQLKDASGKVLGSFYKIAGKDQYIKVGNIDGTKRTLKHNSYVYKSNGKAYTHKVGKKTKKTLKRAGSELTTYGKSFMIHGSQMWRIGHNQYIKVRNF